MKGGDENTNMGKGAELSRGVFYGCRTWIFSLFNGVQHLFCFFCVQSVCVGGFDGIALVLAFFDLIFLGGGRWREREVGRVRERCMEAGERGREKGSFGGLGRKNVL